MKNTNPTYFSKTVPTTALLQIFLLLISLLIESCASAKILTQAALADCNTSTVYLGAWWNHVPDTVSIQLDPMGGYQFAYWVDDAGNVCHGDPGKNGQLGPAVLKAYRPQAFALADKGTILSADRLKELQEIPVPLDPYAGSGFHFVQLYNNLWRMRSDGQTFRSTVTGPLSIPNVIEVGSRACVAPVSLLASGFGAVILPSSNKDAVRQDPNHCKVRTMPVDINMSEAARKKYNAMALPHGGEIYNVP